MLKKIDDAVVQVKCKGNYKFLDLYVFDREVYAKLGNSYIKIMSSNLTSNPSYRWVKLYNINESYSKCVLIYDEPPKVTV